MIEAVILGWLFPSRGVRRPQRVTQLGVSKILIMALNPCLKGNMEDEIGGGEVSGRARILAIRT